MINRLDREDLRQRFRSAKPFPYVVIENLLVPGAAEEVAAAFPSFDRAREMGFAFNFVNEQRKIQVTDASKFPEPVRRLQEAIASPQFLADLEFITGIPAFWPTIFSKEAACISPDPVGGWTFTWTSTCWRSESFFAGSTSCFT